MALFVVINEQGPEWDPKRVMREQNGWTDHAKFMDALEAEHFVVLGGPLKYSKHRAMLIVNASNEQELRKRLAEDPWMQMPETLKPLLTKQALSGTNEIGYHSTR